jgi:hypothetical protein
VADVTSLNSKCAAWWRHVFIAPTFGLDHEIYRSPSKVLAAAADNYGRCRDDAGWLFLTPEVVWLGKIPKYEPMPDKTTVCRFRHLLEQHDPGRALFDRSAAAPRS